VRARGDLAGVLWRLGDIEGARSQWDRILEVSGDTVSARHPARVAAWMGIADALDAVDDPDGARAVRERMIADLSVDRLHERDIFTLRTQGAVARGLERLGRDAEAKALREGILEAFRASVGDTHADTLRAQDNLARLLQAQGDGAGAERHRREVLQARRAALGDSHPQTIFAMVQLAGTLEAMEDGEGARALRDEALGLAEATLGKDHRDTVAIRASLA
jgi:hypothetical protein